MSKILAGFTVLSLLLILFGINRGFDISDEGLYALLAVPEQQNIAGIFNYDLFFKLFHQLTGIEFGIVGLRFLRLTSYAVAALFLSVFWKNFCESKNLTFDSYLISFLGLLAGYAFLPSSLSYNSLTVFWTSLLIACLSDQRKRLIHFILLGTALAALLYIKLTVCFTLGILSILYLLIRKEFTWKVFIGFVMPLLLTELLLFSFLKDCGTFRIIKGFAQIQTRTDYQLFHLLKYTAVGLFWVGVVLLPFVVLRFIDKQNVRLRRIVLVIGLCCFLLVCYFTSITEEWNHIILLGTAFAIFWQAGFLKLNTLSSSQKLWLGILLLLPFLLHFGSNVFWLRLSIHYWVFWVIVLCFLSSKNPSVKSTYLNPILGFLVVLLVSNGIWVRPFEQEPLWKANEKWEYKQGRSILLSPKQVELMQELSEFTKNEQSVLAFYRIPGFSYLLGKTIPKSPGYWDKKQLEFYFPDSISDNLILYHPYDSLPYRMTSNYKKKMLTMPNGEELQVLWRD